MTHYVVGSTVTHRIAVWNHKQDVEDEATTVCGRTGVPVETDPAEDEKCTECFDLPADAEDDTEDGE